MTSQVRNLRCRSTVDITHDMNLLLSTTNPAELPATGPYQHLSKLDMVAAVFTLMASTSHEISS